MAEQPKKRNKKKWLTVLTVVVAAVLGALADTGVLGPQPAELAGALADAVLPLPQ